MERESRGKEFEEKIRKDKGTVSSGSKKKGQNADRHGREGSENFYEIRIISCLCGAGSG